MSGPVPSPSMKGMTGWSGTVRWPSVIVMAWPSLGTVGVHWGIVARLTWGGLSGLGTDLQWDQERPNPAARLPGRESALRLGGLVERPLRQFALPHWHEACGVLAALRLGLPHRGSGPSAPHAPDGRSAGPMDRADARGVPFPAEDVEEGHPRQRGRRGGQDVAGGAAAPA